MTRIRILFAEALRSIGANVSTTVASALSVLIGMFLIGVFIGLGTWLVSWSDDKKRELAVHVFIADSATTKQVNELRVLLESDDRVKPGGITFISKDEGTRDHAQAQPRADRESRFEPAAGVVRRRAEARGGHRGDRGRECRGSSSPPSTRCATARRCRSGSSQIARAIQIVFLIAVFVLLAASTILIANTIRLSVHRAGARSR